VSNTTEFVERARAKLAYDVTGEGDPVLLIHAGIADRRMWDDQLPVLAKHHRVIRFDLQGYGETVVGTGPVRHHEDALAILDAARVPQAAVVGASIGGATGINLVLSHPERVTALVVVGSDLDGFESSDKAAAGLWAAAEEALESGDPRRAADIIIDMWVPPTPLRFGHRRRPLGMAVGKPRLLPSTELRL
jgi:3-oxoadipate enol-lactonase